MIFLSESLVGESVGLREVDDNVWDMYLCNYPLGRLDSSASRLSSTQKRKGCLRLYTPMAVDQSCTYWLTHRHRGLAPSHIE